MQRLKDAVVSIPDFPKPGILFRDVTGILDHAETLRLAIQALTERAKKYQPDLIAGIEARGFIFGSPVACACGTGFVPVRKKGKLPRKTISREYELEYGTAFLELHVDAVKPGQRVVLIDDLIATGGTLATAKALIEELGGIVVAVITLIELPALEARKKFPALPIETILSFDGE